MAWFTPRSWSTSELVTSTHLNEQIRDNMNAMFPIGSLLLRVANYTSVETAVEGRWLQANGVAVSRATYAALFAYLNALTPALPFGVGDGTTTFNLPDFRSRVPVAQGDPTGPALVNALGSSDGRTVANRNISHTHNQDIGTGGAGSNGRILSANYGLSVDISVRNLTGSPSETNIDYPAFLVAGSYFIKYLS